MTTLLHPELIGSKDREDPTGQRQSDWVEISPNELQEFYRRGTTDPGQLLHPDLSKLKIAPANKEAVDRELAKVGTIFSQDEILAGAVLLKTFADEMKVDHNKKVFFSRAALYAWPQGYVAEFLAH